MCPLVAAPNRGYADWQRVDNWDTGILVDLENTNTTNPVASGIIDVSRYGYLGGIASCSLFAYVMFVDWFSDAAATIPAGSRLFVISSGVANPAQLRLPNMGPFCKVSIQTYSPANPYSCVVRLFGTNRFHPCEFIPKQVLPVSKLGGTIPAGGDSVFNPTDYISGPAHIHGTLGPNTSCIINAQVFPVDNVPIFTASTTGILTIDQSIVIPPGAWYVEMTNTSGIGQTAVVTIIPSLTGGT